MLFETSQDILYLVLALCIVWITVFLCWLLYYFMRLARNANAIVEELRDKLELITEGVEYIRGRVEHMNVLMTAVTEGVGGLVKKLLTTTAKNWVDRSLATADTAAKEAVDSAVNTAAKSVKRATARIRRK